MKSTIRLGIITVAFMASSLAAEPPQSQKPQLPKGQMPDLGRPTKGDDQLPLFNFDEYFLGKWTFEWDVPDGPLGPAGRITGTTVYTPVDGPPPLAPNPASFGVAGRFYEAATDATGPSGPIKIRELIAYHREGKALARHVTDSRGFSSLQIATIGGDLGGYYNIYYESSPFNYNGKSIRMKSALRLLSPVNYKVSVTVSENGGPFKNYGNPWWRKDVMK